MKRLATILIVLSLIVLATAACTQTPNTGGAATSAGAADVDAATTAATTTAAAEATTAAATTAAADATTTAAAGDGDTMSEHYTFSYALVGADASVDYNGDEISSYFTTKFNFTWDIVPVSWAEWMEALRVWVSADDAPDLMFVDFNYRDYRNWLDQDLIKRLPDGWKQKYPGLERVFVQTGLGPALEAAVPGEQAVIPNIIFFQMPTTPLIANHMSAYFRKDWASQLGLNVTDTYTLQEYEEMIETFMRDGGSISGMDLSKVDTFAISTDRVADIYLKSQFAYYDRFYKDDSGKYVWGPEDQKIFGLLQNIKSSIEKGIISPNFANIDGGQQVEIFMAGGAFATWNHGWAGPLDSMYLTFARNTELDPYECLQQAVITDPEGHYEGLADFNYWSAMMFGPKLSDAKFERMLTYMDYVTTDEAQEMIRMGVEGRDWERDGDSYKITRPIDEASGSYTPLDEMYPGRSLYQSFVILADDFTARDPAIPESIHAIARNMYAIKQRIGIDTGTFRPIDADLYFFDGSEYARYNPTDVMNDLIMLCTQSGDLRANYDSWLSSKRSTIDPILAELNAALS